MKRIILLGLCFAVVPPSLSLAEDPTPLDEVVVSADPLSSPLLSLPSSTTVVEGSPRSNAGSQQLQEALIEVPNLLWAGGSNRPRFFQIRGVGELEQYEGAPNHSVGLFIDDFDFSGIGSVANLFDTEQVEVLRGPQGLVFGASALAGIVHLKTADPTPYQSARGQMSIGSDDLISGGLALGGPVDGTSERVQFRISAFHDQQNGYRRNEFLNREDTNGRDEFTGRAKLRLLPSEDVTIDLSFLRADMDNGYDAFAIDNSLHTQSDRPGRDAQGSSAVSGKITWTLSDSTALTSTTSLTSSVINYSFDGDWGNNPFWAPFDPYDYFSRTFRRRSVASEEMRLSSVEPLHRIGEDYAWLGGIFVQRLAEESDIENSQDGVPYDTLLSDYEAVTGAAFGQVEAPVAERTSLTAGLRVENRRSDFTDTRGSDFSPVDTMIGGNSSLNHELNEHTRIYGLVSRGYRGGEASTRERRFRRIGGSMNRSISGTSRPG